MPTTLWGKALFCLTYGAAWTVLMLNGLEVADVICKHIQENKKSETTEGSGEDEMVCEDPDRIDG